MYTQTMGLSIFFGLTMLAITGIIIKLGYSKYSLRAFISIIIGCFAIGIIYAVAYPLPMPFIEYLAIEWSYIPPIFYLCADKTKKPLLLLAIMGFGGIMLAFIIPQITYDWLTAVLPIFSAGISSRVKKKYWPLAQGTVYLIGYLTLAYHNDIFLKYNGYFLLYWVIATQVIFGIIRYSLKQKFVQPDIMKNVGFNFEMRRKSIHVLITLSMITYIVAVPTVNFINNILQQINIHYKDLEQCIELGDEVVQQLFFVFVITAFMIGAIVLDFLRLAYTKEYFPAKKFIYHNMRPSEQYKFLASSEMIIGIAVVAPLITVKETVSLIFTVAFADSVGALIGIKYGLHKILDKSVEGTIAEGITTFTINFALTFDVVIALAISALIITLDFLSDIIRVSDNFLYPLGLGIFWFFV